MPEASPTPAPASFRSAVEKTFRAVQDHICAFLVGETGESYREDPWTYAKGEGGGISRIWEGAPGAALEKAGVNFSAISGASLPASALSGGALPEGAPFFATGVSLVLHPRNPHVPTIHMNIRWFEAGDRAWFGGGIDLTPYYPVEAEVRAFHRALRSLCEEHDQDHKTYKDHCDAYFTLKHRGEMRGVGGIFFDRLEGEPERRLRFAEGLGLLFPDLYRPFLAKRAQPFSAAEKDFQLFRRGRYAEFNLLYDRGTLFGLQSGGRTESILMSLPPHCAFPYDYRPRPGSAEEKVLSFFLQPQDWDK